VTLGGEEIVSGLRSGAIDASEWVGPWNDMHLGLHKVSKFYYYPGFHEPGTGVATAINETRWDSLTAEDRIIITAVANAEYTYSLAEFNTHNAKSLQELSQDRNIEIRKFDDSLLQTLGKASGEVMAQVGSKDPLTRRIYQSYIEFRSRCTPWSDMAERAFLNARSLPFPYVGWG
jgi:TRAP-type mannitol/chloroaromatic compound transport system substrate-binding protein